MLLPGSFGGGGGTASSFTPVITLTTISDQDDLSAMTVSLNTVTIGGVTKTPSAVAFRVNGATTGLADPTAVGGTTFTPTKGGEYTFGGTVTIDGVTYAITPQTVTIKAFLNGMHVAHRVRWASVTHDFDVTGDYTHSDGVVYQYTAGGTSPDCASDGANGLTVQDGRAESDIDQFISDLATEFIVYAWIDAGLGSGEDVTVGYVTDTGAPPSSYSLSRIWNDAGTYKLRQLGRVSGVNYAGTGSELTLGSSPLFVAIRVTGQSAQFAAGTAAYSGGAVPTWDSLTKFNNPEHIPISHDVLGDTQEWSAASALARMFQNTSTGPVLIKETGVAVRG